MTKILEINNLKKNYYTKMGEVNAIDDLTFDVKEEEFLCIIGSSGCGKSTFLNIIDGIEEKTKGEIKKLKKDLKIGYMLQDDSLFEWLTILDNACLGLDIRGEKNKENINYVKGLLKKYGLEEFMNRYPNELSGGMRQRVV